MSSSKGGRLIVISGTVRVFLAAVSTISLAFINLAKNTKISPRATKILFRSVITPNFERCIPN